MSDGNLYEPHMLQIHSGQFWRCKHGRTGFGADMEWVGCNECADENPEAYRSFHCLESQHEAMRME